MIMPEKRGNGGHGQEAYDPKTGKYVEDGQPNKYYDNPKEIINEEAMAENIFGMKFSDDYENYLAPEYKGKDDVVDIYNQAYIEEEDPLNDNHHIVEYPPHTFDDKTGKVTFDPNYVNDYIKEVCQKVAFRNLLERDKDFKEKGYKEVELNGEKRIVRNAQDLYKYYKDYKSEIEKKSIQYRNDDSWKITEDMFYEKKLSKTLKKLGLSSVDELFDKYNSLLWDEEKQRGFQAGKNAKQNREAVITTGLPASGKSIMGEKNDILAGLEIDSDIAKELFPEYQKDKTMVSVVHSMSAFIRDVILDEAIKRGYNLSLPTVGSRSNMDGFLKKFKDNGYDVQIANVSIPFEQNVARSITRMIQTGRLTDFDVISKNLGSQYKNVKNITNEFDEIGKRSGISGYAFIDNTDKHKVLKSKNFKYSNVIK